MRTGFLILILLLSATAKGQMLDNTHSTDFEGRPEFVQAFIRTHKVQTIRGTFSTKADQDIIRESKDATYYKFNRFGELTFEYKTVYNDTIYTLYAYDERSNLIIKRTADKYGFQSRHYFYDQQNRVVRIEVRTEQNTGQDIYTHVPDADKQTATELFEYVALDGLNYKKCYLNSDGISYRDEFFYFDAKGLLIKQEGYQKSGSGKSVVELKYDDAGRLLEKTATSSVMGNYTTRYVYEYDSYGNILAMKFYENDIYKTEFQYVYDGENKFLKAIIMRDASTNLMTIVKYDFYTFYQQ
ncbi:MAG: hypothetical protein HYZ14_16090 [Bacteroidetes bacterium]|nr:hypothetical protein [Bacteroidota bacterium]